MKRGKLVACRLCDHTRHANGGRMKQLPEPCAYPGWLNPKVVVWLDAGDYVCTHHIKLKPQPARPALATV